MTPAAEQGKPDRAGNTAAMESLYPFLYAGGGDLNAVMEEVRQSTIAKTAEIADLRRQRRSVRQIAQELGRSPSTVSRELRRNADDRGPLSSCPR